MSELQLRSTVPGYALLALAVAAAAVLFSQAIGQLYAIWNDQPEYSYGILIPFLSAFLIWRERHLLRGLPFTGSWYGLALILVGLALRLIGQLSTMHAVVHYAFLLVLYGLVLALTGPAVFRRLLMPLLILIFMVPLPPLFSEQLSLQLQLLSSQLGVWVMRAAGVSVFLEGNVIDLGTYQLEVAEACSGLRYLFPLMTLAFMIAYAFRGPLWKRAIVFLSSIPVTVLMNSLRIGLIGITVEHWGQRMAEGFLHEFEGWAIFMISSLVVLLIAIALNRPWRARQGPIGSTTAKALAPASQARASFTTVPRAFIAATVLVALGAALEFAIPARAEAIPARAEFVDFPSRLGTWSGTRQSLQASVLDLLRLDDYLLADYHDGSATPINLYVAYYQSQRNGFSIHSPRRCIPGGGWEIRNFGRYTLHAGADQWPVNRVLIEQGTQKALVYYWFQERGRRLTSEYVVRWYLFWDALKRNRTDGALVRLVIPVPKGVSESSLDDKLALFAAQAESPLSRFVPD
ncbi:MAG TPA: VPLPA-CTERM-specific exosortase XrtD [Steroidobacteraceae bacterium]|nr:VPLPA-CTERM-specific exosortase XrtD [Steroidobacteraceae bacterium]